MQGMVVHIVFMPSPRHRHAKPNHATGRNVIANVHPHGPAKYDADWTWEYIEEGVRFSQRSNQKCCLGWCVYRNFPFSPV